jgi:Methyltransferase domain
MSSAPVRIARAALPEPIRHQVQRYAHMALSLVALWRLRPRLAGPVDESLAHEVARAWGNADWAGRPDYLAAVLEACVQQPGPVLECGSGASTILLAATAGGHVYSLEHDRFWARRARWGLRAAGLRGSVMYRPLRDYDGYQWYENEGPTLLPKLALVICDGPPGSTRGGRYGLLPRMRGRLEPGCLVLLDDAEREGEQETIARWQSEFEIDVLVDGDVAKLRLP